MMFRFKLLITISFILCTTFATAQSTSDALRYLETIGNQFQEISSKSMSYVSAASHGKGARKVEKRRTELLNTIKAAEADIRKMKPHNGDAAFRDSVISYLKINHIVLNEDFGKILNMEEIAEQSYDAMEAYLLAKERANEKLDRAYENVRTQQAVFAATHNIKLADGSSKLSQKIETSSKVFHYYNTIYLLFFKSFKNEAYVLDAVNRKDINAMEQTKNSLLESAEQDLRKLGPIHPYKGDATLKNACQQLLGFYKMEASQKIPEIINFQLKKENFEKMKAAIDAKRPAERTQQDIDNFNKTVKDYNDSATKINAIYNELDKKRNTLLEQWNKASDKFLDTYIPKHN
jgi:hypothetical protein